jgi:hypothetical protein
VPPTVRAWLIFPDNVKLGGRPFAMDLGADTRGLGLCTTGFLAGALLLPRSANTPVLAGKA